MFVVKHRTFLESEEVSQNLCKWIDLIFGYKQKGKDAEESMNLFYYLTYEDNFELDKVDPKDREGYKSQIIHFGQTPIQLLNMKHPKRVHMLKFALEGRWILDPNSELVSLIRVKGNASGGKSESILKLDVRKNKIQVLHSNGKLKQLKYNRILINILKRLFLDLMSYLLIILK